MNPVGSPQNFVSILSYAEPQPTLAPFDLLFAEIFRLGSIWSHIAFYLCQIQSYEISSYNIPFPSAILNVPGQSASNFLYQSQHSSYLLSNRFVHKFTGSGKWASTKKPKQNSLGRHNQYKAGIGFWGSLLGRQSTWHRRVRFMYTLLILPKLSRKIKKAVQINLEPPYILYF